MWNAEQMLAQALSSTNLVTLVLVAVAGLVLLVGGLVIFNFFFIWLRALSSGARVTFFELIALRLRNVPVSLIVDARITAVKSGLTIKDSYGHMRPIAIDDLSTHFLAGGNVEMVVQALIAARKAGIHLEFDRACAIDLATKGTGKTVYEAVKTSVNPKVIDCPNPASGKVTIDAVAKDGIAVKVKARVTVRTNLDRFVGGATEETIIARVGEGIVTTIGSSNTYKDVLENPDRISKTVLDKALDSNTAFEILSIDIADVDVGENVGAKLQAEQAEANKLIAQAQAEVRRALAVALEQENVARVQEMRARVVEAEVQVPLAMAEAFRSGNLGVMDYYRMKNLQADTSMRDSIAGASGTGGAKPGGAS
ncbi:MAG TPA: flotillin-like protein FloA [Methylomirabilota bacterium]|nr:flotillin-like protein FloA [Methylomirabilota bacterium]